MQSKTTRAFRTISEAGEELDLQPHVLRFWESKFPQIKPIKRGGGRRFYRPEDIEFIRGIKILLHDEKHPIKDVQKLIRVKGPGRVMELGRSREVASREKRVQDTVLVPERILNRERDEHETPERQAPDVSTFEAPIETVVDDPVYVAETEAVTPQKDDDVAYVDLTELEHALEQLEGLKSRWSSFVQKAS